MRWRARVRLAADVPIMCSLAAGHGEKKKEKSWPRSRGAARRRTARLAVTLDAKFTFEGPPRVLSGGGLIRRPFANRLGASRRRGGRGARAPRGVVRPAAGPSLL